MATQGSRAACLCQQSLSFAASRAGPAPLPAGHSKEKGEFCQPESSPSPSLSSGHRQHPDSLDQAECAACTEPRQQQPGSLQANSRLQSSVLHQPPDGLGSAVGPNMQPFQVHCSISSSQGSPGLPAAGARSRAEKEKLGTPNSSFSLLHSLIVKVFYRLSEWMVFDIKWRLFFGYCNFITFL